MTVNLMDLVKGAVGSQIGPLAGILGESEQNTNSAIGAAIPAILGGLMKKGSTNDGANQIFKTLDDHDGGMLDNLGGLLGGGNHTDLANKGNGLLDMIFGGSRSGLLGTVARIAGLGDSKMGTLMSLLAPIVMGFLGKQRRSQNLDVGGMMNLLNSQKDHLAGHMPGELSSSLGLGNIFSGASDAVSGAASAATHGVQSAAGAVGDAAGAAAGAVGDAGRAAGDAAKSGGGMLMALLPLLLLAGLLYLGYTFFIKGGAGDAVNKAGDAVAGAADNVAGAAGNMADGVSDAMGNIPKLNIPGFDAPKITSTFGDLTTSLGGIKDAASAEAVKSKFESAGTMLDGLNLGDIAAGPNKEAVGGMFGGLVQKLKAAIETAYKIPGVEGVLKPVVDPFLAKLAPFGI